MKRTMVFGFVGVVLVAAVALSEKPALEKELQIQIGDKNPWTSLKMNNDPDDFRFAVVSDRTGGHRPKIFSQAMQQINVLQPEFVMSVGDLIEGYSDKSDKVEQEWTEFQSYVKRLKMPTASVNAHSSLVVGISANESVEIAKKLVMVLASRNVIED